MEFPLVVSIIMTKYLSITSNFSQLFQLRKCFDTIISLPKFSIAN